MQTTETHVIAGRYGALEYRPAAGVILIHHVACWSSCGLVAAGPTCLGGRSDLLDRPVHIGVPGALDVDAELMAGMSWVAIRVALADLYERVMPDPDSALSTPAELPPPVDPGLDTPCHGPI